MSNVSEVIDLYLYDVEVSDELFRRLLHDAIERDGQGNVAALRALTAIQGSETAAWLVGYSVKA
jgi:hypothetical protein